MARIAVLGLGYFGQNVAKSLFDHGHEVMVIDRDVLLVNKFKDYSSVAIEGDISDRAFMEKVGFKGIDTAIVCTAKKIDVSAMAVLYLKEFRVPQIVAKVLTEDQEKILRSLGANQVVFPERDAGYDLAAKISHPGRLMQLDWEQEVEIAERMVPKCLVSRSLAESDLRRVYGVNIIAIKKNREGSGKKLDLVDGGTVFEEGDVALVIGREEKVDHFLKLK